MSRVGAAIGAPSSAPSSAPIRVLLVDDHAVVRAGYTMLLKRCMDIDVVAEASTGESACQKFLAHAPDVVIMDLSLPGIGGMEAIRRILTRDSAARILVFSMHDDTLFVERALANGARGYITKRSAPDVLVDAVRRVAAGGIHLDPELAERLALKKARGHGTALAGLSTREFEIFCLLAEGIAPVEIGRRLCLSPKTVSNYGTQIRTKLCVGSAAELTKLAIRHGIVAT
jgi:DNA-binding NarL/FixJ family response regulator